MSILKRISNDVPRCDVCASKKSTLFRKVGKHTYQTCSKCGTIYLTTRELNLQKKRETYLENPEAYLDIINPHGTRYMAGCVDAAYASKIGQEKGKLLEIGSGLGHLSYMLFSRDWDVSCLELSQDAADWSEKVFKLPTHTTPIEQFTEKNFKAFVMVEVIEHLYAPYDALAQIRKLAAKDSLLFGTTPNIDSEHWKISEQDIYQPHDHIVLFSKLSLTMLLKKAKLRDITIEYFGMGHKNDSNLMFSARI